MGGEVELFAIIDDEQCGFGKILFLEAVLKFLKQGGIGLEGNDDRLAFGDEFGERFVGESSRLRRLDFFDAFFGFDRGLLGFLERALTVGEGGVDLCDVGAFGEHRGHDVRKVVHGHRGFAKRGEFLIGGGELRASGLELLIPFLDSFIQVRPCRIAADRLDASNAGCDGAFGFDFEKADVAGVTDMRAAAEFLRVTVELVRLAADLHDADDIAVFVAKELHDVGAALDVGMFHFGPGNRIVGLDGGVDLFLHRRELRGRDSGAVEVEAQAVLIDRRALLRGILRDDFVERPVQQVGRSVMGFDRAATRGIDLEDDFVADFDFAR